MKPIIKIISLAIITVFTSCSEQKNTNSQDWAWLDFQRPEGINPIISPDASTRFYCPLTQDSVDWESNDTFNPSATIIDGKVVVLYRAEDKSGEGIGGRTSRLGYAWSEDGLHFQRLSTPVFYPDNDSQKELEWPGGCEDPRVTMTEDGLYVMLYTQWNRKQARLAVATSRDLRQWNKYGPAFAKAYNGRFFDEFSKSASIITKVVDGKQVIAKINNKYWMYWGEKFVNVATSDDLINWTPMLDENGDFLKVIKTRPGKFDSELTECGPPAVMTDKGILLMYNGKNKAGAEGDTLYTANSYCAGQALFDLSDPTKLIDRLDKPFYIPQADFEKSGQYPAGTVFIEGLVYHQQKWFLYYGCADSRVAVAVYDPKHVSEPAISPFKDGDRAVFLGNSITDGGHYHSYIWLYYMTRFPDMNLRVINAGIGGNTAYDMYNRLDADVFNKRPTVLTVTFGMNDSGYFEYNGDNPTAFGEEKYQDCLKHYKMMEKRLQGLPNTQIILMGSSPYDETAQISNTPFKGKNKVMQRIVEFQKESATQNNWQFVDLNEPMTALNQSSQQKDPAFTLCGNDRIHPDNDGHMVMAYLFLKAQGFTGKEVANIEVDASGSKVAKSANCEITNVKKSGEDFSFDYLANALPYPLDTIPRGWEQKKSQAKAVNTVPFIEEMNQEILKVTGLKGDYKLFIDHEEIGVWNGNELAKGINLATESKTPQYQQALAVMHLNEYRWEIERTFRQYAWIEFCFFQEKGLLFADNREAIDVLDKNLHSNIFLPGHRDIYAKMMHPAVREAREQEMETLIDKIYQINKPVRRKIMLRKI